MNFFFRHPVYCVKSPRKAYATVKSMREYRKEHPRCEITGKRPVHIHHIKSIWARPDLAADPSNFISLAAKGAHFMFGHAGNWKQYVKNLRELSEIMTVVRQKKD